jgi:hypothetical protein
VDDLHEHLLARLYGHVAVRNPELDGFSGGPVAVTDFEFPADTAESERPDIVAIEVTRLNLVGWNPVESRAFRRVRERDDDCEIRDLDGVSTSVRDTNGLVVATPDTTPDVGEKLRVGVRDLWRGLLVRSRELQGERPDSGCQDDRDGNHQHDPDDRRNPTLPSHARRSARVRKCLSANSLLGPVRRGHQTLFRTNRSRVGHE